MARSLLVTGAAGFIGANFAHYWMRQHPEDRVVAFDALTYAGNRANLTGLEDKPNFSFVHADICDYDRVLSTLRKHEIDTVVHFAAESHVDRSITGPDAFIETNVVGTHSLLKAARDVWMGSGKDREHRFHHVSTDEVYGSLSADAPGFHEEQKYEPNSPYSASKAASDHLVRAYQHTFGVQVTTSNCSNNYGPYHFPEKLIPLCLTNILRGRPLPVYGDGSNIRDWLYVEDHCRGIEMVILGGRIGDTYNIGGNNEWNNLDIVHLLCDQMDERFAADASLVGRFPDAPDSSARDLITFVEDRAGHDWRYAIDATKITRELGYTPHETFETGLKRTLDWYLANEDWWRPLLPS
ncbi:dTDP-glucose 4,6-dehydratase [Candidatus Marimicrobium litorale]|uniref:dTDP-glucose 4,6-dehydratase n=1 Tax=Candidatus Marimicrobium litorale TaxID=2518991 RepID=A0ABT3T7Q1_9GAMM|nr:dTDP-glucose 4,6-dehydratase [Candidatus Marimicrobium litorale]MCX2978292.1 dTDP-glucose 4,6-dehydratase [Candidatus Marimicrobium litorale]